MNTEIKTLNGWCEFSDRTGKESIYDYLNRGDIVSEDIVDNFYDISRALRPTYMTFAKCDGHWRYYGNCFAYETIDRS